jgi:hypothetical protein
MGNEQSNKMPIAAWISIAVIGCGAVASFSVTQYQSNQNDIKLKEVRAEFKEDKGKLVASIEKLIETVNAQTTETKLLRQEIQFIRSERRR